MGGGFLIVVMLHGAYDAFIEILGLPGVFLAVIVETVSWLIFLRSIRHALSKSPWHEPAQLIPPMKFCYNCGTRVEPKASFCINCGQRLVDTPTGSI